MGIAEIRKLKEKKGTVMTAAEYKKTFAGTKVSNNMEGKFHQGYYGCSKGSQYFRSKWEANYSLYLDWLVKQGEIIDWKYEEKTFFFDKIKLGTRSYTPDFEVHTKTGIEYHEVKGFMDSKSATKLKRMRIYFKDVKLVLIEKKQYSEILKKMKGLIKFYD